MFISSFMCVMSFLDFESSRQILMLLITMRFLVALLS